MSSYTEQLEEQNEQLSKLLAEAETSLAEALECINNYSSQKAQYIVNEMSMEATPQMGDLRIRVSLVGHVDMASANNIKNLLGASVRLVEAQL